MANSGLACTLTFMPLSRPFRLGFLVEQTPDDDCRVTLSPEWKDSLGLKSPVERGTHFAPSGGDYIGIMADPDIGRAAFIYPSPHQ